MRPIVPAFVMDDNQRLHAGLPMLMQEQMGDVEKMFAGS